MPGETLEFPPPAGQRLESWKAIATYLKRDITTVQRWEKREGLPVHRHMHGKLGSVYAFTQELDGWVSQRGLRPEKRPAWRRTWFWIAVAGLMGFTLVLLVLRDRAFRASPKAASARRVWTGPDLDRLGSVSFDGRYLSFTDPASGDAAIYEITTGRQWRVTAGRPRKRWEYTQSTAMSPDGNRIAYVWGNQEFLPELRLAGIHGEDDRVLFRDPGAIALGVTAWSRDGTQVAVAATRRNRVNQVLMVAARGGTARVLTELGWRWPASVDFSPDGRHLAYDLQAREGADERDVFVIPAGGNPGDEVRLVQDPADDFLLGWTPDGRCLLFGSDRTGSADAWMVRVRDGKPDGAPQLISKDIGRVVPAGFTRVGSFYYGVRLSMSDVFTAEIDPQTWSPGAPVRLSRLIGSNRAPEWSPDGRHLACVSMAVPGIRYPSPRIIIRSVETGKDRELWPDLRHVEYLRWMAGGKQLLATGWDRQLRPGLFRIDPDDGGVRPIDIEEQDPKLYYTDLASTPDSARLFYKVRTGQAEPSPLFVYDLRRRTRTEFRPSVYRFALSPDGRELAWSNYAGNRQQSISITPAAGGPDRELCRIQGQVTSLAWTPDARYLLFFRRDELWKAPTRGGAPERIASIMPNLHDLRLHPSGRRIAFTGGEARSEVWVMEHFLSR